MKWLTLARIKSFCRIDTNTEQENLDLELLADDAEQTLLNVINRSYDELLELYGEVPAPLITASLQLVELNYNHRAPVCAQMLNAVGYGFEFKIKPYIKLADC